NEACGRASFDYLHLCETRSPRRHSHWSPFLPIAACGPPSPILPELCRTQLGLLDARAEFEPGILVLLQCDALRRPALPGMQSRERDPKRLQRPRYEMQHKRQRHFAFVLPRWLTWFYPQVCRVNFALPCRQPPPQIADVTYLGSDLGSPNDFNDFYRPPSAKKVVVFYNSRPRQNPTRRFRRIQVCLKDRSIRLVAG